jgi:hypothetical protein
MQRSARAEGGGAAASAIAAAGDSASIAPAEIISFRIGLTLLYHISEHRSIKQRRPTGRRSQSPNMCIFPILQALYALGAVPKRYDD